MLICTLHSYLKQSLNDQVEAGWLKAMKSKSLPMVKVVMTGLSTISQSALNQLCVK